MSQESLPPAPKEPRKRAVKPSNEVQKTKSEYDQQGWLSGKRHEEVIRKTSCGCETHELSACFDILYSGKTTAKDITEVYNRYADINLKVHHAYREQGHRKVWELAEEVLKTDTV
jgi:hypothetical protein